LPGGRGDGFAIWARRRRGDRDSGISGRKEDKEEEEMGFSFEKIATIYH
jgi:hypothetical protein